MIEITNAPVKNLKALPDDFKPALPSEKGVDAWVASALDNNPSLKAQRAGLDASEASVKTARAGHYPTLGLTASYGKAITGLYDPAFIGANKASTSVGLTLNIPIFSGLATQSGVRSALAQRDAAADGVEQTKRSIERELAMVKFSGTGEKRMEALRLADAFRARVIDATTESFIFELTGKPDKIDQFISLMVPLGLIEVARTGVAGISRGAEAMKV